MTRIRTSVLLVALASVAAGCATEIARGAGDAGEVGAALARLHASGDAPVNAAGAPMVYLAYRTSAGPAIGAFDMARGALLWHQPAEPTGRIEVGRSAIVHATRTPAGAAVLVGRDAASGDVIWRQELPGDQRLHGYAVDGDACFYVVRAFSDTGTHGAGRLVALDARTGATRWQHTLPAGDVAAPAARGGLVAVPVATQYVILHDAGTGAELARILSTEQSATFVRALPEGIFFGSKGVFRASVDTAKALRKSDGYAQATLPAFVRPIYAPDMYRPEQSDYSALDRKHLLWRPAADPAWRRMAFRDGLVVAHDFRFFFAIEAATGALRWAHVEKGADAVAAAHTGTSLVYVTADGDVGALDPATGRGIYRTRIPDATMVRGATFDADGFTGAGGEGAEAEAPDLAATLSSILWDGDRRFSEELAAYTVAELGRLPGRAVTADLIKAVQAPPAVLPIAARRAADDALATRHDAASEELFVEALKVETDYADDTRPTSVAAIARATLATKSKVVAMALAPHLLRPETEPDTIALVSQALAAAGAVEALPVLRDFVCMYRGEPAYDGEPSALIAAATALLQLGGPAERELLLFIAEEPRTVEPLRRHLQRALAGAAATTAEETP